MAEGKWAKWEQVGVERDFARGMGARCSVQMMWSCALETWAVL